MHSSALNRCRPRGCWATGSAHGCLRSKTVHMANTEQTTCITRTTAYTEPVPSTIGMDMNEINDEIKLTINTMQCDIGDAAHDEMQKHLNGLLEIKRNELQQRLVERSWLDHANGMGSVGKFDQAPYKSVKLEGSEIA